MNSGIRMMMMRGKQGQHNDRRYDQPERRYEDDAEIYDYDRYRYKDGRFAPKPRGKYDEVPMDYFYDDRGRKHYDNGRYAPMRSAIGFDLAGDEHRYRPSPRYGGYEDDERERMRRDKREIGHAAVYEDDDGYFFKGKFGGMGMDGERGKMYMLGGERYRNRRMDKETAEEWTEHMENEDGTKGPHWSMEQIKQLKEQKGLEFDLPDLFAVMNMMYSDYCEVAKKFNINSIDFYIAMAKAWLEDDDVAAGKGKTIAYYECAAK